MTQSTADAAYVYERSGFQREEGKRLTLPAIRQMFVPGSAWQAENTYRPEASGPRTVIHRRITEIVWMNLAGTKSYMKLPKASQVIEARDGYLSFWLFTSEEEVKYRKPDSIKATLTLTRTSS
jgi:hypothetical protein